jgi:hypothetical protein
MNFQIISDGDPSNRGCGRSRTRTAARRARNGSRGGEALPFALRSIRTVREPYRHLESPRPPHPHVLLHPVLPLIGWGAGELYESYPQLRYIARNGCSIVCFFVMHIFTTEYRKRSNAGVRISAFASLHLGPACGTMGSTSFFQEISSPPCGPKGTA